MASRLTRMSYCEAARVCPEWVNVPMWRQQVACAANGCQVACFAVGQAIVVMLWSSNPQLRQAAPEMLCMSQQLKYWYEQPTHKLTKLYTVITACYCLYHMLLLVLTTMVISLPCRVWPFCTVLNTSSSAQQCQWAMDGDDLSSSFLSLILIKKGCESLTASPYKHRSTRCH